jgi:hypothetical protein
VRLCRILDHDQVAALRDFHDRIHVGRLAVQMHRHDRARPRCYARFDLVDIHRAGDGIDID